MLGPVDSTADASAARQIDISAQMGRSFSLVDTRSSFVDDDCPSRQLSCREGVVASHLEAVSASTGRRCCVDFFGSRDISIELFRCFVPIHRAAFHVLVLLSS